jgi:transcriptional regulator with XRE-family HTH domain
MGMLLFLYWNNIVVKYKKGGCMHLGEKLKQFRKRDDLTLDRLAEMTGVAKATLSRIENGVVGGNMDTIKKISSALHVSFDELVSENSGEIKTTENDSLALISLKHELKSIVGKLHEICDKFNIKLDSEECKKGKI